MAEKAHDQVSGSLLMIRPANFSSNALTITDNVFQLSDIKSPDHPQTQALIEFDDLVSLLRSHDIKVQVFEDTPDPVKPDAVFPNNWVSFHPEGVVLYPLRTENRRLERRVDILQEFLTPGKRLVDLSQFEESGEFLEGTGSLVLDRVNKKAYASLSQRTHASVVDKFCSELGYKPILFSAKYKDIPIYHTNVLVSVGAGFAIVCVESMSNQSYRDAVVSSLTEDGKDVIEISLEQCAKMVGNCLQVRNSSNQLFVVMSEQARNALDPEICHRLEKHGTIISSNLAAIESFGGGSARCMITETFIHDK